MAINRLSLSDFKVRSTRDFFSDIGSPIYFASGRGSFKNPKLLNVQLIKIKAGDTGKRKIGMQLDGRF
jgi:hypothetical protein